MQSSKMPKDRKSRPMFMSCYCQHLFISVLGKVYKPLLALLLRPGLDNYTADKAMMTLRGSKTYMSGLRIPSRLQSSC